MVEEAGGSVLVVPPVEIDIATAGRLAQEIADAFADGAGDVHVDFARVTFCDSTGLRVLVDSAKHARALGRRFTIVDPTRRLLRLAEIIGASEMLGLPPPNAEDL